MKQVLHVGSGPPNPRKLNPIFRTGAWREVRLDIDPATQPDIVASITAMPMVGDASFHALWSSHNLEHLYAHEVPAALKEFRRVLRPDGFLLLTLPDLEAVAAVIAKGDIEKPLVTSLAGESLTAVDMLYGWRSQIAAGRTYMAHRTGFTASTLGKTILAAGFRQVRVRQGRDYDLWALAYLEEGADDPALLDQALRPEVLASSLRGARTPASD